ncbi:DUF732 domain-containing protein [Amycolatopsis sp. DSM 110486]|uniref:DUF732 domain-containing protein n=1 Tax=Amycolatopsis sp. DSM 110486 TaxID=2865832 RepID=UPI001C6A0155|nr:DUF732 domain-containing protein [Amycolatopsis sp. DSM 110486]QYN21035.1 DUF732 domain-containing protein [Amycolatopsis sp. DSM 110486]
MRKLVPIPTALVLLTACGGPDPAPVPTPKPSPRAVAIGPRERAYLAALGSIDPALVTNMGAAIAHAHDLCDDVAQGKDHAAVLASVTWYFISADVSVDQAKAEKILAAAESLC